MRTASLTKVMLELYKSVLACIGPFEGTPAVFGSEAAANAYSKIRDHDAAGRQPCCEASGGSLCSRCEACGERRASLYEEFHAAEKAANALCQTFVSALLAANWGRQSDGTFITRTATGIATGRYVVTLHAPGRQGPLAEVVEGGQGSRYWATLHAVRTTAQARQIAADNRARRRDAQAAYETSRQAAGRRLLNGEEFPYEVGQMGGCVVIDGMRVSALGALRAAGYSRGGAEEKLAVSIDETTNTLSL